jgi:simple sugar transport system ATP-binding protein
MCSMISGLYRPTAGELLVDGEPKTFKSPKDALAAGIGMVYQHFRLVTNLTVAENLALGHPDIPARLSQKQLIEDANELGERYNLPIDPTAYVWHLSVGQQQRVEILKLLYRNVQVLILDEPTAVLTPQEGEVLFSTMRQMADEGRSLIFISHKLHEVKAVSDRVSVLRDGTMVGAADTADAEPRDLARMMVGRDLELPTRAAAAEPGAAVLSVRDLKVKDDRGLDALDGVTFDVRAGEVVGIAGVAGNGQRELAFGITGIRPVVGGSVVLSGNDISKKSVAHRIDAGISYIPQSRLGLGLAAGLSAEDNFALKGFRKPPYARGAFLNLSMFGQRAAELQEEFDVRGVRPGLPIRLLSGGNLQKALLAREVTEPHILLIARSPTRGLDVGATETVRNRVLEERADGIAVLLISEDMDELLALSDRVLVLFEGKVAGEMPVEEATPEKLGLLMAGVALEDH